MRSHRSIYILLLVLLVFGSSITPALSAISTSSALSPLAVVAQLGSTTGSVSSLGTIEQAGNDNNPAAYVLFTSPETAHFSYSEFRLSSLIKPSSISAALLQVNYSGPTQTQQLWTWSIYDWSMKIWIPLGNTIGITDNQWHTLYFRVYNLARYVSSSGYIRIQLKSSNKNGDARLDYEALHLTYLPVTATPTRPTATAPGTKSKYTFPITFTPTMTYTPTNTFTPTRTPTRTATPTNSSPSMGPLQVSSVNPRYFADSTGKIVYLTGSHTWCNFMDCDDTSNVATKFNYTAYLNFLEAHNHNFFRMWRAENVRGGEDTDNFWFDPMPYARTSAQTNTFIGNKFNLNTFNQAYFDRLRTRVIEAGNRGIYVSILLFDGWSVETKFNDLNRHDPWAGHPYNSLNNINSIDGDIDNNGSGEETHTLANPAVTALQEAYVKKVIDTVWDLDNVLYEISNESPSDSDAWQNHMATVIRTYEATKGVSHPVGITWEWPGGSNTDLYNSNADWIALGGGVNMDTYVPPVASGNKIILADTDHLCGICGNRQWVWKSFTRGENPIYMDFYDNNATGRGSPFSHPAAEEIRDNLGWARSYAERMDLAQMVPTDNTSACSTGYCLRKNVTDGAEYLVFRATSDSSSITVDLTTASGALNYEWFNIQTGTVVQTGTVQGGGSRTFTSPFTGYAVLYIYDPTP